MEESAKEYRFCQAISVEGLYLIISILSIFVLSLLNPPFMVADETNHFFRAAQVSYGQLIGHKYADGNAGGDLPITLRTFGYAYDRMRFDPTEHTSFEDLRKYHALTWSAAKEAIWFPNTAIYSPLFYAVSAMALALCRVFGSSLMQSFYIARISSGVACSLISTAAIGLSPKPAKAWLLFCLCLPEVLGLYSSLSPDGLFIATLALSAAVMSKIRFAPSQNDENRLVFYSFALLGAAVSLKPPYIAIMLMPLILAHKHSVKVHICYALSILSIVLLWIYVGVHPIVTPTRVGIDISPSHQINNLVRHPILILIIFYNTFAELWLWFFETSVATVSWVDAGMPGYFYSLIALIMVLFILRYMRDLTTRDRICSIKTASLLLLSIAGAGAGAMLSTYLTWDEVGQNSISGVLGRYFTPLLVLSTVLFNSQNIDKERINNLVIRSLLIIFLPLSTILYAGAIFQRFWWGM